jgi:transcriptional regulator with XRE-family HTH domain
MPWGYTVTSHKTPLIRQLKARRQTLGWSLAEVGGRCGIDERFLGDWERGCGSPRLDAVEAWAAALGLGLALRSGDDEARPGLRIDWQGRRVNVEGVPVRLTPMEWRAFERLARTPGELVSHQALFRHLYGEERHYRAQSTAVRVLITKLRRLLPLQIEARWGQGYVVRGLDPSPPGGDAEAGDDAPPPRHASPYPAPTHAPPERGAVVALGGPGTRHGAVELRRAEELGVIERFLAERGATRCPDVATIQKSPLPTLVWDKVKRKWVRPPAADREAS